MMQRLAMIHGQNKVAAGYIPSLSVIPLLISLNENGQPTVENRNIVTVDVADPSQTWSLTKSDSWLIITGASYQGDDEFTITAEINTGEERNGTVTVKSEGCADKVISITQLAG